MNTETLQQLVADVLAAWNAHDVEGLCARYSDDLIYSDPATRGEVRGREAFRRYLTKLFAQWEMHWRCVDAYPLATTDGGAFRWDATLRRRGDERAVAVSGMDLVLLRGGLVAHENPRKPDPNPQTRPREVIALSVWSTKTRPREVIALSVWSNCDARAENPTPENPTQRSNCAFRLE